jgi:HK97 gp10 family phage protein
MTPEQATKEMLRLPENIRRAIRQAMYSAGVLLVKDLKNDMKLPKSGRIYKIKKGKRTYTHIASSPDERPASMSGRLRKSINFLARGFNRIEFGSEGVDYATYLEYGTRKMAKRQPFLRTININNNKIISILRTKTKNQFNVIQK